MNGGIVTNFVELEDILDSAVEQGRTVAFTVERGGDRMVFESEASL